jgi:hypothetical protein
VSDEGALAACQQSATVGVCAELNAGVSDDCAALVTGTWSPQCTGADGYETYRNVTTYFCGASVD